MKPATLLTPDGQLHHVLSFEPSDVVMLNTFMPMDLTLHGPDGDLDIRIKAMDRPPTSRSEDNNVILPILPEHKKSLYHGSVLHCLYIDGFSIFLALDIDPESILERCQRILGFDDRPGEIRTTGDNRRDIFGLHSRRWEGEPWI